MIQFTLLAERMVQVQLKKGNSFNYETKLWILSVPIFMIFIINILADEDIAKIETVQAISTETPIQSSPTSAPLPPPPSSPCFYAEPEYCTNLTIYNETEKEFQSSTCHCRKHLIKTNSWICCNITDITQLTSCPVRSNWTNIHMRNVTMKELDISLSSLKLASSLAITDGNIKFLINKFHQHSHVKCLNVSNNNLTEINPRALVSLSQFQVFDISFNNLSKIPKLNSHKNLTVDIRGNKRILCHSLLDSIDRGNIKFVEPDTTHCLLNQTYNWFNSTETMPIRQLERTKQLHNECPKPENRDCKCDPEQMFFDEGEGINPEQHLVFNARVDCSNLGLTKLPDTLPENTIFLNVSNNNITSLGNFFHLPGYENLLRFDADNNQISSMYELEGTTFIETFQKFFLRKNNIDNIPDYLISNALDNNPKGRVLYLGGNKLKCDCNSANVLKTWLLERHNNIPDYNQILCKNTPQKVIDLSDKDLCQSPHDLAYYIFYLIAMEIFLLIALILKVSYDYWKFKTSGYLPWPASKMPKLPCDWLCES